MQSLRPAYPDAIQQTVVQFTQDQLINGGGFLTVDFFSQFTNVSILLHTCFLVNNNAGSLSNLYFINANGQISDSIGLLAAGEGAFLFNFSTSPGFNYTLQAGTFNPPIVFNYTHSGVINTNKLTIVIYYSTINAGIY